MANTSIDSCYRVCGIPQTYTEAMKSPHATQWNQAMEEEMESLKENDTFELTTLPEGKNLVGQGRGGGMGIHCTMKEDASGGI